MSISFILIFLGGIGLILTNELDAFGIFAWIIMLLIFGHAALNERADIDEYYDKNVSDRFK
ncbi:MAG: hypothetical protein AAB501_02080 [Patescibacteria group bacterium]